MDLDSVKNFLTWAEIEQDGLVELNWISPSKPTTTRLEARPLDLYFDPDQHQEQYLICVGVNPRPSHEREPLEKLSAKEADIQVWKNCYLDIEPIHAAGTIVTEKEYLDCLNAVSAIWGRDSDVVLEPSGNGVHVHFAIPTITDQLVMQDFKARLITWAQTWAKSFLPTTLRMDHTYSAARQVKLPGTRKPIEGSRYATFPQADRRIANSLFGEIMSCEKAQVMEAGRKRGLKRYGGTLKDIEFKYRLR